MVCFYKMENLKEFLSSKMLEINSISQSTQQTNFNVYNEDVEVPKVNFNLNVYYVDEIEDIREETTAIVTHFEHFSILRKKITCKFIVVDSEYRFENYFNSIKKDGVYYLVEQEDLANQILLVLNHLFPSTEIRVEIDNQLNKIKIGTKIITLTTKEIMVFEYLNNNRNKLCLRKDILVDVLKYHPSSDSRIVDVYIRYLRIKLEAEGEKIKTIRGKGYIYE